MTLPILVTGGTGTLGRRLVPRLLQAGCTVRVLTRHGRRSGGPKSEARATAQGREATPSGSPPVDRADEDEVRYLTGDLATGEGVEPAVDGVGTIVHCAGSNKGDDELARNLLRAVSARGGAPHLVYISVVGADRIPIVSAVDRSMFGYFGYKLATERVVAESGLPWTTLRATQFHDLLLMVAQQLAKLPVIPLPTGSRFQPVGTDEVAARLVELALGEPAGLVPDLGGPRIYGVADLMRAYLRASQKRRPLLPVWLPGRAAAAVRGGAVLAPEHAVGKRTWEEFLAEQLNPGQPR